jgi:hypothetical protein
MTVLNTADKIALGANLATAVYKGTTKVWPPSATPPSLVQTTGAFNASALATITSAAFAAAVKAGNLVVNCGYGNTIGGVTQAAPVLSDSKSNSYTVDKFASGTTDGILASASEQVWFGHAVAASGGSAFTDSCSYRPSGNQGQSNRIWGLEIANASAIDGAAVLAKGSGTTASATFPVNASANSIIVVMAVSENGITASVPGWTLALSEGSESVYYKVVSAKGNQTFSVSAGGSNQWVLVGAVFH